jgi:hypothetical protein
MRLRSWLLALLPSLIIIFACMSPVILHWDTHLLGPFGGIDAMLQAGLLEWSVNNYSNTELLYQLPIFFPEQDVLGYMDSLLGQGLSIQPILWFANLTATAQYNYAMLISLILTAIAVLLIWRNCGAEPITGAIVASVIIGSPYTLAQLGHLNQLPPPMVFFTIAAVIGALNSNQTWSRILWWLIAVVALVLQSIWGWYGFVYASMGAAIPALWNLFSEKDYKQFILKNWVALPMIMVAVPIVLWTAGPQLRVAERYSDFDRSDTEVRSGSADIKHIFERGVYRSDPSDWVGKGKTGSVRYADRDRQVLNPGYLALALAIYGLFHAGILTKKMRQYGYGILCLGVIGFVFAFGESTGLPFTDKRMLLPFGVLREMIDSLRAFRGAWRFSLLDVLAVAWWAGVGFSALKNRYGNKSFIIPSAMVCLSIPVALPIAEIPSEINIPSSSIDQPKLLLTLPAPDHEFNEDQTEALWLLRAIRTNSQVTGGATGWVPESVAKLRVDLAQCEAGLKNPSSVFDKFTNLGVMGAEIVSREEDSSRVEFWRDALFNYGAIEMDNTSDSNYARWLFKE